MVSKKELLARVIELEGSVDHIKLKINSICDRVSCGETLVNHITGTYYCEGKLRQDAFEIKEPLMLPVKDVVKGLLDYLGVEFVVVPGKKQSIVVKKKAK
jgi:hypothetical protein